MHIFGKVEIDPREFVAYNTHEGVKTFIKEADAAMQDYEFTFELATHFLRELKKELETEEEKKEFANLITKIVNS